MRSRVMRTLVPLLALGMGLASVTMTGAPSSASEPRVVVAGFSPIPHGDAVVAQPMTATFAVALHQDHAAALDAFITSLSDPASPNYRRFVTTAQFAQRFGASAATVTAVSRYFASYGLHVGALSRGRILLHVSGSTTAIAHAFATRVATVRRSDGVVVPQLRASATLPSSIAHDVTGVAGLSSVLAPSPAAIVAHASTAVPTTCPSAGNSTGNSANALGGYTLQQQAQLYGLTSAWAAGHTGAGQTIGVYELGGYNPTDLSTYFSCYGITPSVTNINVDGGPGAGYIDEATLDIEEAAGLAPGATIQVYQGPNSNLGPTDTYQQMADDNTATIVTTSWGTCESDPSGSPSTEQPIFAQMAAQGQTVFSAAGDNGSSDCAGVVNNQLAVDDPSSQPYVTGVGGLTISSITPLSETVWNSGSGGGAGGGGVSSIWSRPTWQNAPGISASQTMRMVPDLSVMGDPGTGFIEYFSGSGRGGGWGSIGGTSIGSPLMSAVTAIAAESCGVSRFGFLNPTLYAMAPTGYIDVTTGSNDIYKTGSYSAGAGYDMASGLGSPNPATFLSGLCPIKFDASKSSFSAGTTRVLANATGGSVTAVLRDSNGHAMPNTIVDISATGTNGRIMIDGDPSSAVSGGHATYAVTTNLIGTATFEVSNTEPGTVAVTLSYQSQPVYKTKFTFVTSLANARAVPGPPSIVKASPLVGGFLLVVKAPASKGSSPVTGYQYSLNGGATWTTMPRYATSVKVGRLARGKAYSVTVRALSAAGHSVASISKRIVTR
ncbi:MAG TPA: protease pro-enzyme activation domain-containing protein [Acidimicrobiales bacterium]|nr:protease pro-enzyme activation domain-containing protein [Acidimicrobiales bacterium]